MKGRVASAFDLDLTGSSIEVLDVGWCQIEIQRAEILFEAL
jgi:hypothetical protein